MVLTSIGVLVGAGGKVEQLAVVGYGDVTIKAFYLITINKTTGKIATAFALTSPLVAFTADAMIRAVAPRALLLLRDPQSAERSLAYFATSFSILGRERYVHTLVRTYTHALPELEETLNGCVLRRAIDRFASDSFNMLRDTLTTDQITLTEYTQRAENTKTADFKVTNLLSTSRDIGQHCTSFQKTYGAFVLTLGEDAKRVTSIDAASGGSDAKFVLSDGSPAPGTHLIRGDGSLFIQYQNAKDVTQRREVFLELCNSRKLQAFRILETVIGSSAPIYETVLETQISMLSTDVRLIKVPAIANLDGLGTVTETMIVINVGTGESYNIVSPPLNAPIYLERRILAIDPAESRLTQVFEVQITLSEVQTPELTTKYIISI